MTALVWLRRDLRRLDQPLLASALRASGDGRVAVVFVVDHTMLEGTGPLRRAWLAATVRALADSYDGKLCVRFGAPTHVVPALAEELGVTSVHVASETEPPGAARDAVVRKALAERGVNWIETGSPYATAPGLLRNRIGEPYKVFTPFSRAWREYGWAAPAHEPPGLKLVPAPSDPQAWRLLDEALAAEHPTLPPAGEAAALARWARFLEEGLPGYGEHRDRPDLDQTSGLSPYLKFGVVHPRTLLADLAIRPGPSTDRLISELAWREFYADVLFHRPDSLWADFNVGLRSLEYDTDEELIAAWQEGRTGYPLVDAGMRQMLATGWMHNRVRMVVASFLVKDLHVWWPVGARWFLEHLIDADLASNNHSWQWVAGTGTDAAPYFRVFNPVRQGRTFDPHGDYVRRWIPELRHLAGASVHEPWKAGNGYENGYPERLVDHDQERREALARYQAFISP